MPQDMSNTQKGGQKANIAHTCAQIHPAPTLYTHRIPTPQPRSASHPTWLEGWAEVWQYVPLPTGLLHGQSGKGKRSVRPWSLGLLPLPCYPCSHCHVDALFVNTATQGGACGRAQTERAPGDTEGEGEGEAGFPLDSQLSLSPHLQRPRDVPPKLSPSLGRVPLTKKRDVLKTLLNGGKVCVLVSVGLGGGGTGGHVWATQSSSFGPLPNRTGRLLGQLGALRKQLSPTLPPSLPYSWRRRGGRGPGEITAL